MCAWTCCCIISAELLEGLLFKVSICSFCVATWFLRVSRSPTVVWRIWFWDVRLSVVLMRASMVSSNCVILRVWSKKSCARVELDSLSWLISNCCLFCVSRRAARLVVWFVRVIEWLFSVSAFWAVFALISLLFALISFRASSILTRGEDCDVLWAGFVRGCLGSQRTGYWRLLRGSYMRFG